MQTNLFFLLGSTELKVILLPCTIHVIAQYYSRRGQETLLVKHLTVKGLYCVSYHLPHGTFFFFFYFYTWKEFALV